MDHNDGTGLLAPKQKSRSCWAAFRAAHRQARDDLKLRWGRGALWSLGVFVFGCLCYVLAYVLVLTSGFGLQSSACAPDGNFVLDPYECEFFCVVDPGYVMQSRVVWFVYAREQISGVMPFLGYRK
jgi:hypothetical protein